MTKNPPTTKLKRLVCIVFGLFLFLLLNQNTCFARISKQGLTEQQRNKYSSIGIRYYSAGECLTRSATSTSCLRINPSTSAKDFWYAEGCINNGQCESGKYASVAFTSSESPNHFLLADTKVDENLGGLQYIYAENYDIEFDAYKGWIAKFTPNNNNSTRKYYWIVLPNEAYATGFGETYVATFENYSEPVYFITYDTHACEHQSQHYCEKASANPNTVEIGEQFLGAFSKKSGSPTAAAKILGKLQSFCRIRGRGDILANEVDDTSTESEKIANAENTSSFNSSAAKFDDYANNQKKCAKLGELRTAMWNSASDKDKQSFMQVVKEELYDIAGVEIYMNQIVAKHGTDGTLHNWLTGQCVKYRGGTSCSKDHTITEKEQGWIDQALAGSNNVNFAIGNATGGSNVGAGKIVCVWDGNKCRTDIDYTKQGGQGKCNVYSPDRAYGECLGMEGKDDWADDIKDSCGSGCKSFTGEYPQYYQNNYQDSDHENSDQDWTTIPYGKHNVGTSGCGPTSMAMLATVATGQDIYPQDIINITKSTGSYTNTGITKLDPIVGEKYGFEVIPETYSSKTDAYTKIKDYLNRGYMIHLSGEGKHPGFATTNTAGHYVGIFSIDSNDKIWVANSLSVGNSQVNLQDIIDAIHNGVFTAIKGNANSSDCYSYCSNGSDGSDITPIGDDGLTIEEAKTFMMNYGANKNNSSKNVVGNLWNICNGGGSNCVTFSAFFMFKFTNITRNGRLGNGNEVVARLKARGDVDATFGTKPRVFAILSTNPKHTAVVLGHHDGKWIIGHASCSYHGRGRGNGGNGNMSGDNKGGGSGFIAIETSDDPSKWQWMKPGVSFAYPSKVYVDKIEEYLKNGI